jgi:hypothetical protein
VVGGGLAAAADHGQGHVQGTCRAN